jgi:hypothetical protein
MKVYETMALSRSGHHSMKNWIIRNLIGFQINWDYKLVNAFGTNFYHLGEANHDIHLSYKFLDECKNNIDTILINYEDAPYDYTIFNEDRIYKGPLSLEMRNHYNIEHKGRLCFIRDFYSNLSSRIRANERAIFSKWDTNEPHLFKVDKTYIDRWKSHANACVSNQVSYLKFEDWMVNKVVRDEFIYQTFGIRDHYGIEGIKGSISSFETWNNVESRHHELNLNDEMKDLIVYDRDLNYLIDELGYDKIKL